jgi:hypothetical protein
VHDDHGVCCITSSTRKVLFMLVLLHAGKTGVTVLSGSLYRLSVCLRHLAPHKDAVLGNVRVASLSVL